MTEPASDREALSLPPRVAPGLKLRGRREARPVIAPRRLPRLQYAVKRAMDYALAAVSLLLALPLIALIGLIIKLDSPGPIFFLQQRVGHRGIRFPCIKFRTMRNGASDDVHREYVRRQLVDPPDERGNGDGGHLYKMVPDYRVTRVGRFLRRTSLDEIPQVINVLRGEMSLVGPRPPLPYELDDYEPWQFERLTVIPGITGLWQVSGRNLLSYRKMCEIDLKYIGQWSLGRDLKILLRTIPVVLFHTSWTA